VLPVRILAYAYRKIGVRPRYMFLVLLLTLIGGFVNIPIFSLGLPGRRDQRGRGAGATAPVRSYLFVHLRLRGRMLIGTAIVAAIVHWLAQIVPGAGIAVPWLVSTPGGRRRQSPAVVPQAPPVAYVRRVDGDAHRRRSVEPSPTQRDRRAGRLDRRCPGPFDGVFLTGIIAGLLV